MQLIVSKLPVLAVWEAAQKCSYNDDQKGAGRKRTRGRKRSGGRRERANEERGREGGKGKEEEGKERERDRDRDRGGGGQCAYFPSSLFLSLVIPYGPHMYRMSLYKGMFTSP